MKHFAQKTGEVSAQDCVKDLLVWRPLAGHAGSRFGPVGTVSRPAGGRIQSHNHWRLVFWSDRYSLILRVRILAPQSSRRLFLLVAAASGNVWASRSASTSWNVRPSPNSTASAFVYCCQRRIETS